MQDRRIKIVHILEGFVGGLATYMCNVLPQLKKCGFDVTLVCSLRRSAPDAAEKIAELRKTGIAVCIIPMCRKITPILDLYCFFAILKLLIKHRFDIVHTHCSKAGAIGRTAASLAGIKTRFYSSHCFAFLRYGNFFTKRIYRFIEKLLGKITTRFIAVSQSDAEAADRAGIFPPDKCVIVNNGLCRIEPLLGAQKCSKDTISKTSLGLAENVFVVTTACRLVEYKGIFTFLEASKLSNSSCIFLIAGDGKLKSKIQKYIFKNSLSEKAKLLGHVSDMKGLYSITDIVVLCSAMEAQPYLLLEAMRAKRPIIATDVAGNRELLANKRGLLVKPSPERIARAVDELLSDESKRKRLAGAAYEYFNERHRLEKQIMQLTQTYKAALQERKGKERIGNYI